MPAGRQFLGCNDAHEDPKHYVLDPLSSHRQSPALVHALVVLLPLYSSMFSTVVHAGMQRASPALVQGLALCKVLLHELCVLLVVLLHRLLHLGLHARCIVQHVGIQSTNKQKWEEEEQLCDRQRRVERIA